MILKRQHFDLMGKVVFEKATFHPPMKNSDLMVNEACFVFNQKGFVQVHGSYQNIQVESGESILMKCGNFVSNWKETSLATPSEAIIVHFFPDVLKWIYQDDLPMFLIPQKKKPTLTLSKLNSNRLINHFIDGLNIYFESPSLVSEELIIHKLKGIVLLLFKLDNLEIKAILSNLFEPEQINFKRVIETNLYEPITINELAQLTNHSLATFNRKFKDVFNNTPANYIKNKKLEKAKKLLTTTLLNITEICFNVGFNDLSSFSKAFTRKYKISPSNYRNRSET